MELNLNEVDNEVKGMRKRASSQHLNTSSEGLYIQLLN
jgi:hypothetical protein